MKTVLITGATGGIGRAVAIAFAKAGYKVAGQYHSNEASANQLKNELEAVGCEFFICRCDVSDSSAVEAMFSETEKNLGIVEVLINNAGIAQQKLFTDITDEDWRKMMGVDLDGTFYCCRAALPAMIREKRGRIINISSMWGQVGASCEVHYSAAKAGVIGLTQALAKEVGPSGITVNAIAPGVIRTPMLNCFSEDDLAALADETPLSVIGEPKNVADAALFLAGDGASFITGQVIGVNGGFVI